MAMTRRLLTWFVLELNEKLHVGIRIRMFKVVVEIPNQSSCRKRELKEV
jgi:hypothetical protein